LGHTSLTEAQNTYSMTPIGTPEPIYSKNPDDPWNRIFCLLFSRRLKIHLSDQFPEGAPFSQQPLDQNLNLGRIHISTKVFEHDEIGDQAIEPLYPYFMAESNRGMVLVEPLYSEFAKALQEALHENTTRSTVARALMQSDLWATYDVLFQIPS